MMSTTRFFTVCLITVPITTSGQACRRLRPRPVADVIFSRNARRRQPGEADHPSVRTRTGESGRHQAWTHCTRESATRRSRRRLTTSPSHRRVDTMMASAIHGALHPDLISVDIDEIQFALHHLVSGSFMPPRSSAFLESKGMDTDLPRTARSDQRNDHHDHLFRFAQPGTHGPRAGAERFLAHATAISWPLATMQNALAGHSRLGQNP
jgi:hypothetical protein